MLFVVVLYFFLHQLSRLKLSHFASIKLENWKYFILVLILLPFNWGFELFKWKHILKVNKIQFSFNKLIRSLLSGVTTGIITPNRLGNFIGRMLFFKGKVRGQLILGTLYSNFAQFLISLLFGFIGLLLLDELIFEALHDYVTSILFIIIMILILFYFIVPYIRLPKLKYLNKKQNILTQFQLLAKALVFPIFLLSGLRYLVFSLQYFFMLMAFGVASSFMIFAGIFLIYLISTLTPSLIFGKLVIRESAGLLVLSLFFENDAIIIVSSLLLWVINLGIPSLFGLFFILRKKSLAND